MSQTIYSKKYDIAAAILTILVILFAHLSKLKITAVHPDFPDAVTTGPLMPLPIVTALQSLGLYAMLGISVAVAFLVFYLSRKNVAKTILNGIMAAHLLVLSVSTCLFLLSLWRFF